MIIITILENLGGKPRVSPVTENAFVWLKIAVPSDLFLVVVRFTNVLIYLLTLAPSDYIVYSRQSIIRGEPSYLCGQFTAIAFVNNFS